MARRRGACGCAAGRTLVGSTRIAGGTAADAGGAARWRAAARAVLAQYPFEGRRLDRIAQGLINLTVRVTTPAGERFVLQRLHPVFAPSVNDNLDGVTRHLDARGLLTPLLVRTRDGASSVIDPADGACWRVLTWIDGCAPDHLRDAVQAHAAGALLARFHLALADYARPLAAERAVVHDLGRHRAILGDAQRTHAGHRLAADVAVLVAELDAGIAQLPPLDGGRVRLVHGDPKISNLLFDLRDSAARCLIDLDTLCRAPIGHELGDAMRSWCNPAAEDSAAATFDLALFAGAVGGYLGAAGSFLNADERGAIVDETLLIYYELAARFLADALAESYFGWDHARYPSRGAHNLARARGQLAAAAALAARRDEAAAIVHDCGT